MTKETFVGISSLTIKIGDTKVNVTPDQARDLYFALHKMYGEKTVTQYVPSYPWNWNRPYYYGTTFGDVNLCADLGTAATNQGLNSSIVDVEIDWQKIAGQAVKL